MQDQPATARYRVEHVTRYRYGSDVSTSQHLACLHPRELPYQRVLEHALAIAPLPAQVTRRVDYFGNTLDQFTVLTPHDELTVASRSLVEVDGGRRRVDLAASPPWETAARMTQRPGRLPDEADDFLASSPYVLYDPSLAAFARQSFTPGRGLLDAALDLTHRIHREFRFDASATTVTTPVSRVLQERHGVCQDFAHLQIGCLRALGLPARYVSGYLFTDPPPGQPRLIGADASHAWLAVHCPAHGWVDLDPTNDVIAGIRHVTVAWGRDFGDVSPLRGVILGGAEHRLVVGVSVLPVEVRSAKSDV